MRHFISLHDLTAAEVEDLLQLARAIKASPLEYAHTLEGQTLAMIFQKPSTRTRVSFEVAMRQLGGAGLFLGAGDLQLGRGETVADTARVLSRYVNGIMARTFAHQEVLDLAQYGSVPVINGLTDLLHPCQALADYFTIREKLGPLGGRRLAYLGDGNNMCHSLMFGAPKVGMHIAVATPQGFEPDREVWRLAAEDARAAGTRMAIGHDPESAVHGADVLYTDVWASMGQEREAQKRRQVFKPYQVTLALLRAANPGALFMHCLPAHRGEEVAADVIDSPQSVVFDQAENRLCVQKAILVRLLGSRPRADRA